MKGNIRVLLVTLLICEIICEIALRINGKYMSYNERIGAGSYTSPYQANDEGWAFTHEPFLKMEDVKPEYNTTWTTNNEGLHNKNITLKKNGKRVLVFGDSFTEGTGAPSDSCYPAILETLLRTNSDSAIEVINCGIASSDIFFEYELLKLKLLKYKPDYVIVTFNTSDYYDFITRGGFERFIENNKLQYRKPPWFEPLYAHSYIARRIVHDVYGYDFDFLHPQQRTTLYNQANKIIASAIDSFHNLCIINGIKWGIVFHPLYPEIIQPENYKVEKLIGHCQEKSIAYADEALFLRQRGIDSSNWQKIYWPIDGHFNAIGYALLAQSVYNLFGTKGWIVRSNSLLLNANSQ